MAYFHILVEVLNSSPLHSYHLSAFRGKKTGKKPKYSVSSYSLWKNRVMMGGYFRDTNVSHLHLYLTRKAS
jgi:hypothetical protein